MIRLLLLLFFTFTSINALLCNVCTDCARTDEHTVTCPQGDLCFTLHRIHANTIERGCGRSCSPKERGRSESDKCELCQFDQCNSHMKRVVKQPYIESELLPLPSNDEGFPSSPHHNSRPSESRERKFPHIEKEILDLPTSDEEVNLPIVMMDKDIHNKNGSKVLSTDIDYRPVPVDDSEMSTLEKMGKPLVSESSEYIEDDIGDAMIGVIEGMEEFGNLDDKVDNDKAQRVIEEEKKVEDNELNEALVNEDKAKDIRNQLDSQSSNQLPYSLFILFFSLLIL